MRKSKQEYDCECISLIVNPIGSVVMNMIVRINMNVSSSLSMNRYININVKEFQG